MTIQELIDYVDRVKPNAFPAEEKVMWLNEVEGMVQTDVLLHSLASLVRYCYEGEWRGVGLRFPAADTVVFPEDTGFSPGGVLSLSGMAEHAENTVERKKVLAVSADGRTVTMETGCFALADEIADSGEVSAVFDGRGTEMLVPAPYHKIYYTYLMAMIDFANGEYNKYQNTMALFNNFFTCFTRWYAQNFEPADGECLQRSCPVSAYAIALRHGFDGTETDFLASLRGNGIASIVRTDGDGAQGTADTYTITMTDGSSASFQVYQGADGVLKAIVDGELDEFSDDPVSNRVITAALKEVREFGFLTSDLLNDHMSDTAAHISEADRDRWDGKADVEVATSSADGLMSAADKVKLDGFAVDKVLSETSEHAVANSAVTKALGEKLGKNDAAVSAQKWTSPRQVLVDLASADGAELDGSADIAPGVSGILPVSHGGTGRSTLTSGYFLKGNGTSAVTLRTAANVRKDLGLGSTTGALPVANGGTGATSAVTAAKNLCVSGEWTPVLKGYSGNDPTYITTTGYNNGAGYAVGHYVRIGKIVFVTCSISGQISNAGSGYAMIDGLPFDSIANTAMDLVECFNCVTITSNTLHPVLRLIPGHGVLVKDPNGTGSYQWKANSTAGGFLLAFSGSYIIDE